MLTRLLAPLLAAFILVAPQSGYAEDTAFDPEIVTVVMDQAKIFRMAAPAGTIIIGNPAIADATMQDSQTMVITGRTYGTTNLIVLDSEGETITDTQIVVEGPKLNRVTVFRSTTRFSYSCTESCEASVVPGDSNDFFSGIQAQAGARSGAASGQAAQTQ